MDPLPNRHTPTGCRPYRGFLTNTPVPLWRSPPKTHTHIAHPSGRREPTPASPRFCPVGRSVHIDRRVPTPLLRCSYDRHADRVRRARIDRIWCDFHTGNLRRGCVKCYFPCDGSRLSSAVGCCHYDGIFAFL